jgi:hypothetical protein
MLPEVEPAIEYLASRGVSLETARALGLGAVVAPSGTELPEMWQPYRNRISLPFFSIDGQRVMGMKFRTWAPGVLPKYHGLPLDGRLYNLPAINRADEVLVMGEGEFEGVTWEEVGYPAVAIPGYKMWKPHHKWLFEGLRLVIFVYDADTTQAVTNERTGQTRYINPGEDLMKRVKRDLEEVGTDCLAVTVPGAKDAGEALAAGRKEELRTMIQNLAGAL